MKNLTLLLVFIAVLHSSTISQIVNGNAFIKGQFVEVGINRCGGWGTTAIAPAGYHARSGINPTQIGDNQLNLGFVADPDMNGWTNGIPNKYNGDYFMPQAPYVGWGVTVNGIIYGTERTFSTSTNCGLLNGAIPFAGTTVSVVTTPTSMQATWQGINSGLLVKKIVTIKTNDLYFTVKVVLRNVSGATLNNIYYGEYVNPDNDHYYQDFASNNLSTTNTIMSQPTTGPALVQAIGAVTGSYLGLGSKDCRAKVFRGNQAVPSGNVSDWYNGNFAANINLVGADLLANNLCVGITFNVGSILSNDSTSFLYTYILKSTDFLPALTQTEPELYVNGILHASGDTIKPCANTLQHLDIAGGDFNTWGWSPPTNLSNYFGIHNIANIGTIPITYSVAGTGACGTNFIKVTFDPILKPTLGPDQVINICPGYLADLNSVFDTTGLTSFWTIGGTPVTTPAAVDVGLYRLIAFSENNCSSDTAFVTVGNFVKPDLGADISIFTCPGFFTDLTSQFITTGLTTNWTSAGIPVANTAAVAAGVYQLIATSTDGCSDTAVVSISNYIKPDLGIDQSLALCPGTLTDLTTMFVTTGLVTNWTSGGLPVSNPAAVDAGIYQLIATNTDGCKDTALVTITNHPKPNLGADVNSSVCTGTVADLTSIFNTTALTTNWTIGGNPVPNPANVAAGIYQLIATNTFGCADTALATINFILKPDLGPDQTSTICTGFFIDLTSLFTTSGFTVNWTSGGNPVTNPTAVSAGIYQLIVSSGSGCKDTAVVTVGNFPKPALGADQSLAVCPGTFSNLTSMFVTTGLVTDWTSGGLPVPNPTSVAAGIYQLIATNTDGCKDTALVTITNHPKPTLGVDVNSSICPGSTTNLTTLFNTTGLTTGWTSGGLPVSNPAAVGAGVYQLIATNTFGCTDTALATINLNPKPNLGPDITMGVCPFQLTDLTTQFITTGLTTAWTNGGVPVINPAAVNTGTYQLIAVNSNGCSDTALVTIFNYPKPNLGVDKNISTCPGFPVNLTTQFITTGLTTQWTTGGVAVSNPVAVSAGIYQLIVLNANGCSDTALVTITHFIKPNLGIDKTMSSCPGFPVNITTLYNTAGLTTQWSTPNPAAVLAGTYTLYVTNTSGCSDTAIITVTNYSKPNLGVDKTVNICAGQTADLSSLFNTAGLTIQWNTATPGSVTTGSYRLIVTNSNGCKDTAIATVQQYPSINLTISKIPSVNSIIEGESIKFIANGTNMVSYSWMPPSYLSSSNSAIVTATPLQTITYKLVVTNNGSCEDSALVTIKVLPLVLVPSGAFTPNGDGYTDLWMIKNIQFTKQNRVAVFNRWGNKVFEATNYQNNWDGKSKNGPLPDGAYYYQIQATTINNRVINLTGSITLLR
jgi:gliding motility-associated-like protein